MRTTDKSQMKDESKRELKLHGNKVDKGRKENEKETDKDQQKKNENKEYKGSHCG